MLFMTQDALVFSINNTITRTIGYNLTLIRILFELYLYIRFKNRSKQKKKIIIKKIISITIFNAYSDN